MRYRPSPWARPMRRREDRSLRTALLRRARTWHAPCGRPWSALRVARTLAALCAEVIGRRGCGLRAAGSSRGRPGMIGGGLAPMLRRRVHCAPRRAPFREGGSLCHRESFARTSAHGSTPCSGSGDRRRSSSGSVLTATARSPPSRLGRRRAGRPRRSVDLASHVRRAARPRRTPAGRVMPRRRRRRPAPFLRSERGDQRLRPARAGCARAASRRQGSVRHRLASPIRLRARRTKEGTGESVSRAGGSASQGSDRPLGRARGTVYNSRFSTLPAGLRGRASTNSTTCGTA
jgi:hypothetical protein